MDGWDGVCVFRYLYLCNNKMLNNWALETSFCLILRPQHPQASMRVMVQQGVISTHKFIPDKTTWRLARSFRQEFLSETDW